MSTSNPDLKPSLIRTLVPFIVGPLVGWLANKGLKVDSVFMTMVLSSIAGYFYYVIVRFFEVYISDKWGYILGVRKAPVYVNPPALVQDNDGVRVVEEPAVAEPEVAPELEIDEPAPVKATPRKRAPRKPKAE